MTAITYAIVFSGEIVEGFQIISVKAHLAKMLKADPAKMQILFSGKPVVLKRTTDKSEAARYGIALKKVGANVRVKIQKAKAAPAQAASTQAAPTAGKVPRAKAPVAAQTAKPSTAMSLKPNEGNLFEEKPEVSRVDIDLSEYSLKENDGTNIIPDKVYERAEIDLSEFSVADNDGSPLAEAAPIVAKLDAPDFGLDEPGAILETLKDVVELLDPDTSGMSLAFRGSDLLNEDEKDPGPDPLSPDTSKISLVASFDQ